MRTYSEQDLTRWFKPNVKPVRPGVYIGSYVKNSSKFRRWDGKRWSMANNSIERAAREKQIAGSQDSVWWRGLNKEPK